MSYMFNNARKFNQDISMWNLFNVTDRFKMFTNSSMDDNYFEKIKKNVILTAVKMQVGDVIWQV